jgi:hypothetical protein
MPPDEEDYTTEVGESNLAVPKRRDVVHVPAVEGRVRTTPNFEVISGDLAVTLAAQIRKYMAKATTPEGLDSKEITALHKLTDSFAKLERAERLRLKDLNSDLGDMTVEQLTEFLGLKNE